jgi:hypothetical protein
MRPGRLLRLLPLLVTLLVPGCGQRGAPAPAGTTSASVAPAPPSSASPPPVDEEARACRARVDAILAAEDLPGAPDFEKNRIGILGRAKGEPLVLVREPAFSLPSDAPAALRASAEAFAKGKPGDRVRALVRRHQHDPRALRSLLLREGYVYASDPLDALALVTAVKLTDLFDEPTILLQRGSETLSLRRESLRKEERYVDAEGRTVELLFGDRLGLDAAGFAHPLHRDLASLSHAAGFDRARIQRRTEGALLVSLRFGETWAKAVLEADGSALRLACLAEDRPVRAAVADYQQRTAPQRRALASLRAAVTAGVTDAMRFDRPEGETGPDRDGHLRPFWTSAYLRGQSSFEAEGTRLPVFDANGHPWPPEVCVDFVLDTFERAAGTWFRPRGEPPGRVHGRMYFDEAGAGDRRGVIGFGAYAEAHPELFEVRRFKGQERIPFGERERFFAFLAEHADEVRPGDVVAIQGEKRDQRIHQHAILVERVDPVTGFPSGLADMMKRPRRRTWEGIMAEAPKRSLLYRARPRDEVLAKIDPGEGAR